MKLVKEQWVTSEKLCNTVDRTKFQKKTMSKHSCCVISVKHCGVTGCVYTLTHTTLYYMCVEIPGCCNCSVKGVFRLEIRHILQVIAILRCKAQWIKQASIDQCINQWIKWQVFVGAVHRIVFSLDEYGVWVYVCTYLSVLCLESFLFNPEYPCDCKCVPTIRNVYSSKSAYVH